MNENMRIIRKFSAALLILSFITISVSASAISNTNTGIITRDFCNYSSNISTDDLENKSTEELAQSILNEDIMISLFASNLSISYTYEQLKSFTPELYELDSRSDAAYEIANLYLNSYNELSYIEKFCLGSLLTESKFSNDLSEETLKTIYSLRSTANTQTEQTSNLYSNGYSSTNLVAPTSTTTSVTRSVADIDVTTVGGNEVVLWKTTGDFTISEIADINNSYSSSFPDNTLLSNPTTQYNCHSYAWYYQSTSNRYWLYDCTPYTYDTHISCSVTSTPTVGAICVYFDINGSAVHSGIVQSVSGGTVTLISKWGSYGLYRHELDAVPSSYKYGGITVNCRYFTFTDTHTYTGTCTQYNSSQHSRKCAYCDSVKYLSHTYKYTTTPTKHTGTCSLCGYSFTGTHTYNSITGACTVCGYVSDVGSINTAPPDVSVSS